jgi:SNF2 family DNA or RNA helicase
VRTDELTADEGLAEVASLELTWPCEAWSEERWARWPLPVVKSAALVMAQPWVRVATPLEMTVTTQGWRFPVPPDTPPRAVPPPREAPAPAREAGALVPLDALPAEMLDEELPQGDGPIPRAEQPGRVASLGGGDATSRTTRLKPPRETVVFKERLLYLLQPPLEHLLGGKVTLPFNPFPYQVAGIAFLMPRHHALIADEMGLGKTVQVIVSMRLLLQAGVIRKALIICPKPLVINWMREMRLWAPDLPFEVVTGDTEERRQVWQVSNCPVKLVNYEILARDVEMATAPGMAFDLVVLDEAQRIKSRDTKTAQAVHALKRGRSWAMSGTPIENRVEDLVNIMEFAAPGVIPQGVPPRLLPDLTSDYILRRTKEMVVKDMPPRIIKDLCLELSPAQRESYDKAEKEGVIELNEMGGQITVRHVFELVMRLKQICNFDLRTGESTKLEQLLADMEEVAANGRKAIIFSQWTQPLEVLARHLAPFGPLLYHGKVPQAQRQPILDQFKSDPSKHVLLMSYGTGSVGLNLQFTNYVFLFDRWWNPAIEDQAINRAHRLGQKDAVFVSRFISQGTIEERIADVLDQKRALFNEMLEGNGPPATLGLTEEEVFRLFDIKARPKR